MFRSLCSFISLASAVTAYDVSISVDASSTMGPWVPIHRFFGADEPNFATYTHGSALLQDLGALGKDQTYFRTHNLLTTGKPGYVGVPDLKWGSTNAYTLDENGDPVYNFTVIDNIFDHYMDANVKPYLQVGFMPLDLAVDPDPYFFDFDPEGAYNAIYTGWTHVPRSYERWGELVNRLTEHLVDRYGECEVKQWYFEVWNEPNIAYWNGTTEEFYMVHDYAVDAIRKAFPSARVGGPETAGGAAGTYLGDFLQHCANGTNHATGETGTPLDFVSFHAKGLPAFINTTGSDGYVQLNVSTQLQQIDEAFGVIKSFPQYAHLPIYMGEYDPDGCAACTSEAFDYRNDLFYGAYSAASFTRAIDLAARRGVNLQGALTWAFEFEKTALLPNSTTYFDGFRVLSTQGISKPILNFFRMWGMLSGDRVQASSSGQVPLDVVLEDGVRGSEGDVGSLATFDEDAKTLHVFVWHYHDNKLQFPDAEIALDIEGLPPGFRDAQGMAKVTHYRVDDDHSNSYSKWLAMGSPQDPTPEQYNGLVEAGKLAMLGAPSKIGISDDGMATMNMSLPIRGLSLLVLDGSAVC